MGRDLDIEGDGLWDIFEERDRERERSERERGIRDWRAAI